MEVATDEKCDVCWGSSARGVWPTWEVAEKLSEVKSESEKISGSWLVNWMLRFWKDTVENRGISFWKHPEVWWSMAGVTGEQRTKIKGERWRQKHIVHNLEDHLKDFRFYSKRNNLITVWKLSSTWCFIKLWLLCRDWFGRKVSPMVWRTRNMAYGTGGLWFWLETILEAKKWKNRFLSFCLTPSLLSLSLPISFIFLPPFLPFFLPFPFFKISWQQHVCMTRRGI